MRKKHKKTVWSLNHHVLRSVFSILKFTAIMFAAFSLNLLCSYAQAVQPSGHLLSGRIISAENGEPVPGANIIIKGTTTGTVTDIAGNFSIAVNPEDILVISFIGHITQEIEVGSKTQLDISLKEDITRLDEVVVIGYGSMKRSDLSSAQVSVSSEEIMNSRATTVEQVLQGRAAGVYVTQNSGEPGGGISVNIRGINSISGSTEPMYVVDGVQIMGKTGRATNTLSSINPNDIESMQILQGPTATAIYGSRAGNGVIVITTKRGKSGETKISYNGTYAIQDEPDFIPVLNLREYAEYVNTYNSITGALGEIPEFQDPSVLGEGTNWQGELFNRAPLFKHQLSVNGGNEKTNFYLSGEYFKQDGVIIESGFDRYSIRLNIDNQTRDWLKIGSNIMLSQTKQKRTISENDILNLALQQAPDVVVQNPDGSWGGPHETQYMNTNPVALAKITDDTERKIFSMGGLYADITPLKGLKFRTALNGNFEFTNRYKYDPSYRFDGFVKETNMSERKTNNNTGWNFLALLEYGTKLGKHDIKAMVSHEAQESKWENVDGSRQGFLSNTIRELSAGDATTSAANSGKGSWAMESYFGRLNYMYNDRYILQATFRADGSPNFGENNRWGYFPAASVAWKISEESFMENLTWIDNFKLRFEYGITGNQNSGGPTYYSTLSSYPTIWGTGFLTYNLSNPDFQWEETHTTNLGLDINMFGNRVEFIVDAYLKNTDNLMMQVSYPYYLSTSVEDFSASIKPPWMNVGAMENRGIGFTLNTVNMERPFFWKTGITVSIDRNKLTKLYGETNYVDRTRGDIGLVARSVVGEPLWQYYVYSWDGLFTDTLDILAHPWQNANEIIDEDVGSWPGDIRFKNLNGDTLLDADDRGFFGNPWPKFIFGLNNTFRYKNLELYIAINCVYGNDLFNWGRYKNGKVFGGGPGYGWGYLSSVKNYARVLYDENGAPYVENPGTDVPRIHAGHDPNANYRSSDMWIEDGSYLRIKNIQLSYSIPNKLMSKLPVKNLRLSAGIQNLYTFTRYKGYDPEVGMFMLDADGEDERQGTIPGYDNNRYPSTRSYTFNLIVDF